MQRLDFFMKDNASNSPLIIILFGWSDSSESSLRLELHVAGSVPVTLLVRDESRSAKSYEDDCQLSPFLSRKVRLFSQGGS